MDVILTFLADMPFWAWFVIAGLFLLAELLTGTTFLLWPAVAAAIMGFVTTIQLEGQWVTQWLLFAVLTVALGIIGRPYAERWINHSQTDRPKLNQFAQNKVGKRGTVAATFVSGRGRVKLGDTEWQGMAEDEVMCLSEGDVVEVVGMDGTVLVVKAV